MRRFVLVAGLVLAIGAAIFLLRGDDGEAPSSAASTPNTGLTTSLSIGPQEPETQTSDLAPDASGAIFESAPCSFQRPAGTSPDCGYLTVPEDRDDPAGGTIRLHVAVFASTSADPRPDPVVYLDGGPGGEPLEALRFGLGERFEAILETRDLIIFDQRGTGFSEPALTCPAYRELGFELLDQNLEIEESIAMEFEVLGKCRDDWQDSGIDLAQYNSVENAADVADLRVALGYKEWNLYGVSYGTRLALTVMRDEPEGVRSVVLDSTYPPEADGVADFSANAKRAFDQLFSGCAQSPACNETYGDIESRLFAVVDAWNASPVTVPVVDLIGGARLEAVVDGAGLMGVVFQSLYAETIIPTLPKLIDEVESGDTAQFGQILSIFIANGEFFSPGMHFSVQCNEEVPFADPAAVSASSDGLPYISQISEGSILQSSRAFSFCDDWGAGRAAALDNDPVESDIATLVLAGSYDPITPPADGRAVAERLTNAFFFEFPGLGHGVTGAGQCPVGVMIDFLDDPEAAPDVGCISNLTGPAWELATGVSTTSSDVALVAFEISPLGLTFNGLIPDGWEDLGNGTYARMDGALDQTAVVVQGYPGEFADDLINGLLDSLPLDGDTLEEDPFDDGSRLWRKLSNSTFGLDLNILVVESEGVTFLVMVLSPEAESEMAIEGVLKPVARSLEAS